jgi:hypothetical protein
VKRDGEWMAVPMCSMNQRDWGEVYEARLRDPSLQDAGLREAAAATGA